MTFKMPKSMSGNRWDKVKSGGYGKQKRSAYMQKPGDAVYPRGVGKAVKGFKPWR